MDRDSKDPKLHPVPVALAAFEQIIEGCKDLACTLALDEFEGEELANLTDRILALYDRFTDRELVQAFEANGDGDSEDVQGAKERVRERLLRSFQESDDPALREIALKAMPTDGEAN